MLWCFDNPSDAAIALSGGDASIVSGDSARLFNGNPGSTILCSWRTGAQTTTTTPVYFDMTWGTARVPKLIGLQNCTLPVGTLVTFSFRRASDAVGTYPYNAVTQRIYARERSEQVCWYALPDGLTAVVGARARIDNDVNGSASIAAGQQFKLGDMRCVEGFETKIVAAGWTEEYDDATVSDDSDIFQLTVTRGTVRRIATISSTPITQQDALQGGGVNLPMDYKTIIARSDRGQSIVLVERSIDAGGAISQDLVNRTAVYGKLGKNASLKHMQASLFQSGEIVFKEIPIPT